MRLAEALSRRADAQKRLEQLRARAKGSARYQEGTPPPEDPAALHTEALGVIDEIEQLVRRINRTNASTELEPGLTITDAIARRDALSAKHRLTVALADAASGQRGDVGWGARQLRSELRDMTDLSVPQLHQQADHLARDHRELDSRLQEANWATELVE
ncbi:MAG: DIP1984 family protein [Actinomycetales bacterium]|nr:DIP1984 family protein [Actinomycetales bacterium]